MYLSVCLSVLLFDCCPSCLFFTTSGSVACLHTMNTDVSANGLGGTGFVSGSSPKRILNIEMDRCKVLLSLWSLIIYIMSDVQ